MSPLRGHRKSSRDGFECKELIVIIIYLLIFHTYNNILLLYKTIINTIITLNNIVLY